jgi:hypothetical protein
MLAIRYRHRVLRSPSAAISLAAALALAAVSGCGGSNPYPVEKVSGKITYEDGSLIPANRLRLIFCSQAATVDPKTPPHKGEAEVNPKTGEFGSVSTFGFRDGIIRGEHKVFVEAVGARKLVPDKYASERTTPLKVNSSESPFTLKVPKPQ